MKNEILEELWRSRDAFAQRHNYDLDAMVAALQEVERRHPEKVVDRRNATAERQTDNHSAGTPEPGNA